MLMLNLRDIPQLKLFSFSKHKPQSPTFITFKFLLNPLSQVIPLCTACILIVLKENILTVDI